jgi:hypothetical protein
MTPKFKILPGLAPYGPLATAFPSEWGRLGREGTVVQFNTQSGPWVVNFRPGLEGLDTVLPHPNEHDAIVISSGDLWIVDPELRQADLLLPGIVAILEVQVPDGWVLSRQGLALARLGREGLVWHTRRLSWDGFDELKVGGGDLTGLAWSPIDGQWHPFRVDLRTGKSSGGSFFAEDTEGWERLADG